MSVGLGEVCVLMIVIATGGFGYAVRKLTGRN